MDPRCIKTDVLIIGSGIAGLASAIKLAQAFPQFTITVAAKHTTESNTRYAQGGIAVVMDLLQDSFQKHIDDTLRAGDGACFREVVEMVIREAPERLNEIILWGAEFDRNVCGTVSLGLEGGHSASRIVHVKDYTGLHLENVLLKKANQLPNLNLVSPRFVLDLILDNSSEQKSGSEDLPGKCLGAYVFNEASGLVEIFVSKVTILATGGAAQIYRVSTNPAIATGDGVAMAYRAKARIRDMAFVQFHPTAFYSSDGAHFLISEAVRGYGAFLVDARGRRFMFEYDARGELAPRDIVSRAIEQERKATNTNSVFLDCRHLDQEDFKNNFPTIVEQCLAHKIDPAHDLIPVAPAAHYFCGGIEVDQSGRTSIGNLYACGECACTGLHGANRLASNSLLEALVYAHHCFMDIEEKLGQVDFPRQMPPPLPYRLTRDSISPYECLLKKQFNNLMNDQAGIVRSNNGLKLALESIMRWNEILETVYWGGVVTIAVCELRNLVTVGQLVVEDSLKQKVNLGTFYNADLRRNEEMSFHNL